MNKNIKIVSAKESDIPEILHFITQLAIYEKLEHEVVATEESLRKTLFGEKKFAEVIFLEEDGSKAGFALFFHSYSTFLALPGIYLEDLFVLPEHRGKGYGKRLLSHLAKIAVERGCGRLEWSVLDWNKPAIDFYLSLGSKPMDEWTVHRVTGEALEKLATIAK
ncbi:N-acetyltransferase family protein [Bdellovibrio sp. HCB274]|uniref:GNAT family N-acetyltransferase n=1 Tax=Bdellovibrio sp. HCB274 TaxID=3394361 RepID=UPI0039B3FC0E